MYDSTFNTQLKRDHNYEASPYICNPIRYALIWPDNSLEEICKWEIGASSYLDVSCICLLIQDVFPTLLPSQASLPVQFSVQVKWDCFHNLSIPQFRCQWMFFAKIVWNEIPLLFQVLFFVFFFLQKFYQDVCNVAFFARMK